MKRKLVALTLVLAVVLAMAAPTGMAAAIEQTLKASYGVQILYNNKVLESTVKPFIVNGTTYVPLRMLMENFGDKQIVWDGNSSRVLISSALSQTEAMYMQQITSRNATITELENKVKSLESQLAIAKAAANAVDLDDLEDDLNDDYGDYEDLDLTITLSGDNDRITLKISISKTDWDSLTLSEQEDLLQDICDDIWGEAEDAEIVGSVRTGSTVLDSFTVDPDDNVSLSDLDLDDLEDDLNDDYDSVGGVDFSYTLSGDEDDITITVKVTDGDWSDLDEDEQIDLLQDIADDIWDEAEDADLKFVIKEGTSTVDTIYVDAGDDVEL